MTDQKSPEGPQERLEGGSVTPAPPEGQNGPQAGVQGLAPWTQLEARAFNAVQPALRAAGEWLPLSARRAVANAVLAELKRELDALAEYENAINWMTTCTSCARVLDSAYAETVRAEHAEAAIARVRALAARIRQGVPWTANDDAIAAHIEAALNPPAHNAGPSVREAAANDRAYWERKESGEGQ